MTRAKINYKGCMSPEAKESLIALMDTWGLPRGIFEEFSSIIEKYSVCDVVVGNGREETSKKTKKKQKKKRAPSAYNTHMKECLSNIKNEGAFKNVPHQKRFSECVKRWKVRK